MEIRAAVLENFGEPLEIQELDLAEPKAGEVLVRLVACGVCHTDLYTASGADPSGYSPTVLGHEGAGVVEQVGDLHLAGQAAVVPRPGARTVRSANRPPVVVAFRLFNDNQSRRRPVHPRTRSGRASVPGSPCGSALRS